MLDLHRLRLLRELNERGTIAAVADALRFTPSAVSQQLSVLERETGVKLLQRAGRGVRLTDAAVVLVGHAEAMLERAELAETDLEAASGKIAGLVRIGSFQSTALRLALPAMRALAVDAPELRCELVEAEPEGSLPALALGDLDLVLADEWKTQPHARPYGVEREELFADPVRAILPSDHPAVKPRRKSVELSGLAGEMWISGHPGTGWEDSTRRLCRELGGFDPDIRHRVNDSVMGLALVAAGNGVTLLPDLVQPEAQPGVAARQIAEGALSRSVFMAARAADAARPSVVALKGAIKDAVRAF